MTVKLPSSISSLQDLKTVTMEIRGYSKWFAHNAVKSRVSGATKAEEHMTVSETAANLIREAAGSEALTQKVLDELVGALEKLETSSLRATITLAAMPGNGLKKQLVEWFRKNVSPEVLVDFRFNATILGGMVVQFGSHVHDWSFRRAILANRAKFPERLRHV